MPSAKGHRHWWQNQTHLNKTRMNTKLETAVWRKVRQCLAVKASRAMVHLLASLWCVAAAFADKPAPAGMALVPQGIYQPIIRSRTEAAKVPVNAFYLDATPVPNKEFLKFVRAYPCWQPSQVRRNFADESYLKNWSGDLELGSHAPPDAPVVYVSWFAAKTYAQWRGKRLPTIAEWEYAAGASMTRPDGQNDPAFKGEVLRWYADSTATEFMPVEEGTANFYGIRNLHGLVWEWVGDFNSAMFSGDSRDGGVDGRLFCGAGAQSAQKVDDYPAFMRYAFRSSLRADYCIHNLGFRCAKDL